MTHLTIKTHKAMEKTSSKTKVYNVIIMDRSGSMWDIQKSAIHGYNEVLGGIKADAKTYADTQEHFMTLVLFDSTAIENVYWNENPEKAAILTTETYVPGAATPLYDAIGKTLTQLQKEINGDPNATVIVTIITDGYENSSTEYTLKAVQALIQHLKEQGWSFAYMGTDHDVDGVTVSLSITNVVKFEKTEAETQAVFEKERRARKRYNDKMAMFDMAEPCASAEKRLRYRHKLSEEYYKED
jgi:protein involved in ribonucleotide reduction